MEPEYHHCAHAQQGDKDEVAVVMVVFHVRHHSMHPAKVNIVCITPVVSLGTDMPPLFREGGKSSGVRFLEVGG